MDWATLLLLLPAKLILQFGRLGMQHLATAASDARFALLLTVRDMPNYPGLLPRETLNNKGALGAAG